MMRIVSATVSMLEGKAELEETFLFSIFSPYHGCNEQLAFSQHSWYWKGKSASMPGRVDIFWCKSLLFSASSHYISMYLYCTSIFCGLEGIRPLGIHV